MPTLKKSENLQFVFSLLPCDNPAEDGQVYPHSREVLILQLPGNT